MKPTPDSSYIQQHLANERTFLAWVRTALAMKGIGFLVFGAELLLSDQQAGRGAIWISLLSFTAGAAVLGIGTYLYFKHRKTINTGSFQAASGTVAAAGLLSGGVLLLLLLYAFYLFV
ncbi:YidH family protein [Bacillus daqingensis]|uniref:YidH family protein n=1 Tax=Bacillus daqingensis TaxID=872396 RepID=A0ABV9NT00_9BACI